MNMIFSNLSDTFSLMIPLGEIALLIIVFLGITILPAMLLRHFSRRNNYE